MPAGNAPASEPGSIAFLDRAHWQQSRKTTTEDPFAQSWLTLKRRMLDRAECGLAIWGAPETGMLKPAVLRIGNPQVLKIMVGTTGIEPVTPTMSMLGSNFRQHSYAFQNPIKTAGFEHF